MITPLGSLTVKLGNAPCHTYQCKSLLFLVHVPAINKNRDNSVKRTYVLLTKVAYFSNVDVTFFLE